MSAYKPLVVDTGQVQQLQGSSELDIPLEDRFQLLKKQFRDLVNWMIANGFELPPTVTQILE